MSNSLNVFIFTLIVIFESCSGSLERYDQRDSPTSGTLAFICEEGLSPRVDLQASTFLSFYPNAKIVVAEKTEKEAVEGLFRDSCKAILINRDLSQNEKKSFASHNIHVVSHFVAKNAVALIVSPEFSDSIISLGELERALLNDSASALKIVFDKSNSGTAMYIVDSILKGKKPGKNCFAAKNTEDLLGWISKDKNSIGLMDYAWISDSDDPKTQAILKKVKILPLAKQKSENAYYPDQSNIATGDYPLCRNMYFIRRGADFSLPARKAN
jgi:phosphate transport system substrate-binding protein